jgi:integrase
MTTKVSQRTTGKPSKNRRRDPVMAFHGVKQKTAARYRPDLPPNFTCAADTAGTAADMGRRRHLDAGVVRRLPAPTEGNVIYFDDEVPGFGVRVTAGGFKAFIFNYRTTSGRQRRYTIGACSDWSCTEARAKAKRLRHDVDDGGDPLADIEAEREAPTMVALCDRFEAEHLPLKRASTQDAYQRMLRLHVRPFFGAIKVQDVRHEDVDRLHRAVTKNAGPYMANRVVAVLSKMFSLAIRWHMRADNPAKGVERNNELRRQTYLKGDELVRLIQALAGHGDKRTADVIRLLLLTGCRRGEALSARWADINLAAGIWSKPASSTKQAKPHEVPLSAPALQLLSEIQAQQTARRKPLGTFVFPGGGDRGHVVEIKKGWRAICKAAGITGLRIHDLRHSYASQLVSSGASLPLIGALLGHSSPTTTARYAHLQSDPLRKATETVGAVITAAGKAADEPVKLKTR